MTEQCSRWFYGNSYRGHGCSNKGKALADGRLWCKIHDPRLVKQKDKVKKADWTRDSARKALRRAKSDSNIAHQLGQGLLDAARANDTSAMAKIFSDALLLERQQARDIADAQFAYDKTNGKWVKLNDELKRMRAAWPNIDEVDADCEAQCE